MKLNWKKILVIWVAAGILVAGLNHIYPEYDIEYTGEYAYGKEKYKDVIVYDLRNLSLLVTLVVGILIYGLKVKE